MCCLLITCNLAAADPERDAARTRVRLGKAFVVAGLLTLTAGAFAAHRTMTACARAPDDEDCSLEEGLGTLGAVVLFGGVGLGGLIGGVHLWSAGNDRLDALQVTPTRGGAVASLALQF